MTIDEVLQRLTIFKEKIGDGNVAVQVMNDEGYIHDINGIYMDECGIPTIILD